MWSMHSHEAEDSLLIPSSKGEDMLTRRIAALFVLSALIAPSALPAEPFAEGMVSITFDDGDKTQYLSRAVLAQYGYRATYFLISDSLSSWGDFFTISQVMDLAADRHEIGSHTLDHVYLTQLSDADLDRELSGSRSALMAKLGLPDVQSFSYPYGDYDSRVEQAVAQYYQSARTTEPWYNFRDTDPYLLGSFDCNSSTTVSQMTSRVDQALSSKSWVVFHFHRLTTTTPTEQYACMVSTLSSFLGYLTQRNAKVVTISEGVALMTAASATPPRSGWR